MSLADDLNDSDLETLRKLLKQSGRAALERRKALCIEIGIDSGEISGIGWLSENDFAVELIDMLVNRELEGAVFKLCETLKRDFDGGIISSQLGAIVAKLKQPNSQPDYEVGKPPSSQGEDYPNLSLNNNSTWEFLVQWKKHLLASGTIILIGLAGFQIYKPKQSSKQPAIPPPPTNQTIDYSQLEKLLAKEEWKKADKETTIIMLEIANRKIEGFLLNSKHMASFNCKDLDNIDRLWMKYSNGRFGFSVQNGIYQVSEDQKKFYVRVGWFVKKNNPVNYDSLIFSQNAPRGHLPTASGLLYGLHNTSFSFVNKNSGRASNFFYRFGNACKQSNETANQPANGLPGQVINSTQIPKVDYSRLENFLKYKNWKDADEETRNIMGKVSGSEQEGWVSDENGQNFFCLTLKKIDQDWLKSSDRRFGYSVQKNIWRNRISMDVDDTNITSNRLEAFFKGIDWMEGDPSRTRQTLIVSEEAPVGHFPTPMGKSTQRWLERLFECRDL